MVLAQPSPATMHMAHDHAASASGMMSDHLAHHSHHADGADHAAGADHGKADGTAPCALDKAGCCAGCVVAMAPSDSLTSGDIVRVIPGAPRQHVARGIILIDPGVPKTSA